MLSRRILSYPRRQSATARLGPAALEPAAARGGSDLPRCKAVAVWSGKLQARQTGRLQAARGARPRSASGPFLHPGPARGIRDARLGPDQPRDSDPDRDPDPGHPISAVQRVGTE